MSTNIALTLEAGWNFIYFIFLILILSMLPFSHPSLLFPSVSFLFVPLPRTSFPTIRSS